MPVNMCHTWNMTNAASSTTKLISVPQVAPFAPDQKMADRAQILKILGEPMRLSILSMIMSQGGEAVCACDVPFALGISQPTASHHLKKLTDAGILEREQRGKWAWFTLVPGALDDVRMFLGEIR